MFYGKETNVKKKILKDVKRMEPYGTPNVKLDSTPLVVVSVPLIAPPDGPILEFPAKKYIYI